MSNSGPLLPTVTQGVQGTKSPHEPLSPLVCSEEEGFSPSPSNPFPESATIAPFPLSPSKNTREKKDASYLQTDLVSQTSENLGAPKQLGSPRVPPSGKERCSTLREIDADFSEMFQDEGGGDGPAFVESDDEGAAAAFRGGTPPTPLNLRAARWADSLQNLLSDVIGAKTFKSYLEEESASGPSPKFIDSLFFSFACRGLKGEKKKISESVLVIWKRFLCNKAVKISRDTFIDIERRIMNNDFCDSHIFDQAQKEVEETMSKTSYRAFLKSDRYLSFLQPSTDKREGAESPHSPCFFPEGECCSFAGSSCNAILPTLHEDDELCSRERTLPCATLTSNNLLASLNYRANLDRVKPEAKAGLYLKENIQLKHFPYHLMYGAGPVSSLQDSELQSFSSGANTDDTSFTGSSVDLSFSRSQLKRQNQRMKENALKNKEPLFATSNSGVHIIPRTMLYHRGNYSDSQMPRAETNPKGFARVLTQKLILSLEEQQSKENVMHSMCKITSEDSSEEARREHAVNALPPDVLMSKLNEKVCLLEDQDPSQSILDDHIARVWDSSPICSPSSPKVAAGAGSPPPAKGVSKIATKQLPHLAYPYPNSNSSHMNPKCSSKNGRHHNPAYSAPSGQSGMCPSAPQSMMGARKRHPQFQSVETYRGHVPHAYQSRTHHGRRRERGPDAHSTISFSTDSGNVTDYHDVCERIPNPICAPPSHIPKSKSMPEYIENNAGTTSDGASGRRHQMSSGVRRNSRRTATDFTDSGVSVVSDSGRSGAPSTSSDRVETWLNQNKTFNRVSVPSYSVCPGWERDSSAKDCNRVRGTKSVHTVAGSTSPGTQRKGGGSSGRRSQCSSNTSATGTTCINVRSDSSPILLPQPSFSRDSPLGQAQTCDAVERRKSKGSSSSKSTGPSSSSVGEGSGSNGSTMKKQHKSSKQSGGDFVPVSPSLAHGGNHYPQPQSFPEVTTVVYSFQDDLVPFIIKIPSRPVTLKRLKQHLHKKGDYRYFFKKFCEGMGMVNEEITEDSDDLPLFEGKVFAQIHQMHKDDCVNE